MTYNQAIKRAQKLARERRKYMYIVYDPAYPNDEYGYDVVDDYDLDTFYLGLRPQVTFAPGGECAVNV